MCLHNKLALDMAYNSMKTDKRNGLAPRAEGKTKWWCTNKTMTQKLEAEYHCITYIVHATIDLALGQDMHMHVDHVVIIGHGRCMQSEFPTWRKMIADI